jgi:hypothetical protein
LATFATNEKAPVAERAAKKQAKVAARNAHVTIAASEKTHKVHYPENEKRLKHRSDATKRLNNQLKWSTNQFHVPKPKAKKAKKLKAGWALKEKALKQARVKAKKVKEAQAKAKEKVKLHKKYKAGKQDASHWIAEIKHLKENQKMMKKKIEELKHQAHTHTKPSFKKVKRKKSVIKKKLMETKHVVKTKKSHKQNLRSQHKPAAMSEHKLKEEIMRSSH